ncbi:MAG TPA: hypothetical protein VGM62_00935 [Chthoniobacterales bacterium]
MSGSDHGVAAAARVLTGVMIGRTVTAKGDAALLAGAEMHPIRADLYTLGALEGLRMLDRLDCSNVRAATVRHRSK